MTSKEKAAIAAKILTAVTILLAAPITIMAYGLLFGAYFTPTQLNTALCLGVVGLFTGGIAGICWGEA